MVVLNNPAYFDLKTIADSGQCFRIFQIEDNIFDVLSTDKWVRVWHEPQKNIYVFGCDDAEFEGFWEHYFDLRTDYATYHKVIQRSNDSFLKSAADYGSGMRILRQSYWETIVSFIISQNNNIPRIKKSIEMFCWKFGKPMTKYGITRYSFPYKSDLMNIKLEDLSDLGLGYRDKYIYGVCVCAPALLKPDKLLQVPGIGPKVESCIKLFGCHEMNRYPRDTWINKMINEIYGGNFDTSPYEGFEGFAQQLQFYYYRYLKIGGD